MDVIFELPTIKDKYVAWAAKYFNLKSPIK